MQQASTTTAGRLAVSSFHHHQPCATNNSTMTLKEALCYNNCEYNNSEARTERVAEGWMYVLLHVAITTNLVTDRRANAQPTANRHVTTRHTSDHLAKHRRP